MCADNGARILIVDDQPYICSILQRCLSAEGYDCQTAASAEQALALLQSEQFSLLLSDVTMPGMSGLELLALARVRFPDLAVIMVTALGDRTTAVRALQLGAFAYLIKPFELSEVAIHAASALERRRLAVDGRLYQTRLEGAIQERTAELRQREEEMALRLVWATERRDEVTGAHIRRIGLYSATLAAKLGWTNYMVDDLRVAAAMHDIGKIGIPDHLLFKPGKYTPEEYAAVKKHADIGASILEGSDVPLLQMAREIAFGHHEKWNGTGYPQGLKGETIPESARIVAIADVYDALLSDRPYKTSLPEEQVVETMKTERGAHFDPRILDQFLELLPQFCAIRNKVASEGGMKGIGLLSRLSPPIPNYDDE